MTLRWISKSGGFSKPLMPKVLIPVMEIETLGLAFMAINL